jgi:hypothetical protein
MRFLLLKPNFGHEILQMNFLKLSAFLCCLISLIPISVASDLAAVCPDKLENHGAKIGNPPAGWIGHINPVARLSNVGFAEASPELNRSLAPSFNSTTRNKTSITWKFEGDYPSGKWIQCSYAGGALTISKQIEPNTKSCTVNLVNLPAKPESIQVVCK